MSGSTRAVLAPARRARRARRVHALRDRPRPARGPARYGWSGPDEGKLMRLAVVDASAVAGGPVTRAVECAARECVRAGAQVSQQSWRWKPARRRSKRLGLQQSSQAGPAAQAQAEARALDDPPGERHRKQSGIHQDVVAGIGQQERPQKQQPHTHRPPSGAR